MKVNLILILTILLSANRTDATIIDVGYRQLNAYTEYKTGPVGLYCQCIDKSGYPYEPESNKDDKEIRYSSLENFRDTRKRQK